MQLKGSETEKNLKTALYGETMAQTKYYFFAEKAKEDGYNQIADIFNVTAENEKAHAKIWYKLLYDGVASTDNNLDISSSTENYEWSNMYPNFAEVARKEGFDFIAGLFEKVAEIEKEHENRFKKLLENVNNKLVFSKDNDVIWQCRNCGHICIGKEAPNICPVCAYPQAYFENKSEKY